MLQYLEDKAYQPNPIQIEAGGIIIWTNNDLTTHTVTEGAHLLLLHLQTDSILDC